MNKLALPVAISIILLMALILSILNFGYQASAVSFPLKIKVLSRRHILASDYSREVSWVPGREDTVMAYVNGALEFLNINNGQRQEICKVESKNNYVEFDISSDGRRIVFCNLEKAFLYNLDNKSQVILPKSADTYQYDWAPDNQSLVYNFVNKLKPRGFGNLEVWRTNIKNGENTKLTKGNYWVPKWSPRGDKIAFRKKTNELWIMEADGTKLKKLADAETPAFDWTPDGTKVVYFAVGGLFTVDVRSRKVKLIATSGTYYTNDIFSISPDSKYIVYSVPSYKTVESDERLLESEVGSDIYIIDIEGKNKPVNITNTKNVKEYFPRWSLTGDKIICFEMPYASYEKPIPTLIDILISK